ncbi:ABC transporter permease [Spiroplasma alleghenense]|uniref:Efflux ABC transporter, permease protein n=1 Tax=Spiroplasma alleghenense TaxID=216931 RepID=A0A345Z3H3_9MOLU|nr:ABC transporter permease [Spiroplasma alleghenense]AXK51152.1 efflux ABC transporter, permease protein [Spiroplasma alleghenense]
MKRNGNWFLFFKQSFRNIFKFRVQFIIVIVLTFMSTLILTVSLGVSSILRNSHDQIVNTGNKFDYEYQYQFEQKRSSEGPNQTIPLNDYINNNYSHFIDDVNFSLEPNEESAFNFLLSNDQKNKNEEQENFLVRFYKSEGFQKAIYELFLRNENGLANAILNYDFNPNSGKPEYNNNNIFYKLDNPFLYYSLDNLKKEYAADLGCADGFKALDYTKYTVAGMYTAKNGCSWLNEIERDNGMKVYMNYAFQNLIKTNFVHLSDYANYYMNQILDKIAVEGKIPTFGEVNTKWGDKNTGITLKQTSENKPVIVDEAAELTELFFQYLLGFKTTIAETQSARVTEIKGGNFLISKNGQWINEGSASQLEKLEEEGEIEAGKHFLTNQTDVYEYGRRGQINPMVIFMENNKFLTQRWLNDHWSITGLGKEEVSNTSSMQMYHDFYTFPNQWDFEHYIQDSGSVNSSMFLLHQKNAAQILDFDTNVRTELFYFDNESQSKFRAVAIDSKEPDSNLTIIKGKMPRSNNEVAISQQYAKRNKLKVGNLISIGGTTVVISGFATDKYSFYPMSDNDVPLPDNKNGVIIYGSKNTIAAIRSQGFENYSTNYNTIFLTNKGNEATKNDRKSLYSALLSNQPKEMNASYKFIKSFQDSPIKDGDKGIGNYSSLYSIRSFDNSNFSLNWSVYSGAVTIFNIFAICSSIVIAAISLAAIAIGISKTIRANMGQIINLKALGVKSSEIGTSYLVYGFLVIITIPVAWIVSSLIQIPLFNIFANYFSAPYNSVYFDWVPLIICVFILGGVASLVAYLRTVSLTKGSIVELQELKDEVKRSKIIDKIKNTWFKNASFSKRFSIDIASTGSRQTWMVASTIFISSFFIGGTLALPSIAINFKDSYYKSIRYSNEYSAYLPVGNSPFSKSALNTWEGHENLEKDWKDSDLFKSFGMNGYYSNRNNYTATSNNVGLVPNFINAGSDENFKVDWSVEYLVNNLNDLVPVVSSIFGTNFYNVIGQAFSVGELEQFLGWVIHSVNQPGKQIPWESDKQREEFLKTLSDTLTKGIGPILSLVMGSITDDGQKPNPDADWKTQILDSIIGSVPPYVKAYVNQSESRKNQFAFGYSYDQVIPDHETLATKIDFQTSDNQKIKITGLPKTQNAYTLSERDFNRTQLSKDVHEKITQIIEGNYNGGDIEENGIKVYDKDSKTILIPVIANRQAESSLNFYRDKVISGITPEKSQLTYLSKGGYKVLPKGAWIYDDSDWIKFKKTQKAEEINQSQYLDPFAMDNNKFTYNESFNNDKVAEGAFVFADWDYDKTGNIVGSHLRPYYNYDNLQLWFPEDEININELSENSPGVNKEGTWKESGIDSGKVPESVKAAWGKGTTSTTWTKVLPYDLTYDSKWEKPIKNLQGGELNHLLNKVSYFMQSQLSGAGDVFLGLSRGNQSLSNNQLSKVDIVNVGELNSYNDNIIIGDQEIVNSLAGYSNTYFTPYNYNPDGKEVGNYKGIKTFETLTPEQLVKRKLEDQFRNNFNGKINYWWNTKLSNVDETIGITSYVSFNNKERTGNFTVGGNNRFKVTTSYEGQSLLSETKALVNQISGMAALIGVLLVSIIIITSSLFVILICDLLVSKNSRFIILMKSLGYSKRRLVGYIIGTVTVFSIIGFVLGLGLSYLGLWGLISLISNLGGVAIPFALTWWAPFLAVMLVGGAYSISIFAAMHKVVNTSPHVLTTVSE